MRRTWDAVALYFCTDGQHRVGRGVESPCSVEHLGKWGTDEVPELASCYWSCVGNIRACLPSFLSASYWVILIKVH